MRTMEEIKAKCEVTDDGHWLWEGSLSNGRPNMWAPDYTRDPTGKKLFAQKGARAVWHMKHKRAISDEHQVYVKCWMPMCVSPGCVRSGTPAQVGRSLKKSGVWKNQTKRIIANRATMLARRKVDDEMADRIQQATGTYREIGARFGINKGSAHRYKNGFRAKSAPSFFGALIR